MLVSTVVFCFSVGSNLIEDIFCESFLSIFQGKTGVLLLYYTVKFLKCQNSEYDNCEVV